MNSITRTVLVLTTDAGLSAQVAALFSDRYRVVTSLAEAEKPDAAVCEAALLAAQDFALLKRLLAQDGGCAVFLLGEAEEAELERAFALGLEDVIAAPFSATTAKMRMARALARRRSGSADPLRIAEAIIALDKSMIEALAAAIEFRSRESGDHVRRIHDITAHLLGETPLGRGYSAREIKEIALASILHDVGKIAVPDQVLNKPGKLNDEEFAIMRSHTVQGETPPAVSPWTSPATITSAGTVAAIPTACVATPSPCRRRSSASPMSTTHCARRASTSQPSAAPRACA